MLQKNTQINIARFLFAAMRIGTEKINRDDFLHEVTQRYAYITVTEQAEAQGFRVTTEESQTDGSIRLVMQRWQENSGEFYHARPTGN